MYTQKIYYCDTDAGGIVYYANYLKYFEIARTELLEEAGLNINSLLKKGVFFAVRYCNVKYLSPARYGDIIECPSKITRFTGAQIIFNQSVLLKDSKRELVIAEVSLVCLNKDFKPQPLPEDFKSRLIPL